MRRCANDSCFINVCRFFFFFFFFFHFLQKMFASIFEYKTLHRVRFKIFNDISLTIIFSILNVLNFCCCLQACCERATQPYSFLSFIVGGGSTIFKGSRQACYHTFTRDSNRHLVSYYIRFVIVTLFTFARRLVVMYRSIHVITFRNIILTLRSL